MKTDVAVREKPIIFSWPMVRAILEGRKTQTRRVINPQPMPTWMNGVDWSRFYVNGKKELWLAHPTDPARKEIVCPYGVPGDRLWVRETHYRFGYWVKNGLTKAGKQRWSFRATNNDVKFAADGKLASPKSRRATGWWKRPAIFMPRWASRITLEITEVRVQRVQEISEEDASAEGADRPTTEEERQLRHIMDESSWWTGRIPFRWLWDSINLKRRFGWDSNPFVWCVSFKRLP